MARRLLSSVWQRLRGLREREQPDPLYCPKARQDPYRHYQRLRETDPVHCIPDKGVFAVARAEHVEEVLGSPDLYLSSDLHNVEQSLQGADDPGHARVRKILSRVLNSKRMGEWEGPIRKLTEGFIARAVEQGRSEFVSEIATPLPLQVVSLLLEFDPDRWEDYNRWSEAGVADEFAGLDPATRTHVDKSLAELDAFLADHLARCRRGEAGGDFNTEVVPDLTDQEALDIFRILLIAGNVTTKHLIGNIAVALAEHPKLFAQLRRDPSLIPAMVEETLRINGPTLSIARRTAKETRLGGVTLPADSPIFILLGSANRQEDRFPNPDTIDLKRSQRHLAFGHGIHFCIGASLSRLEARILIETMLKKWESFSPVRPVNEIEWDPHTHLRGPKRFELIVKPRAAADRSAIA